MRNEMYIASGVAPVHLSLRLWDLAMRLDFYETTSRTNDKTEIACRVLAEEEGRDF